LPKNGSPERLIQSAAPPPPWNHCPTPPPNPKCPINVALRPPVTAPFGTMPLKKIPRHEPVFCLPKFHSKCLFGAVCFPGTGRMGRVATPSNLYCPPHPLSLGPHQKAPSALHRRGKTAQTVGLAACQAPRKISTQEWWRPSACPTALYLAPARSAGPSKPAGSKHIGAELPLFRCRPIVGEWPPGRHFPVCQCWRRLKTSRQVQGLGGRVDHLEEWGSGTPGAPPPPSPTNHAVGAFVNSTSPLNAFCGGCRACPLKPLQEKKRPVSAASGKPTNPLGKNNAVSTTQPRPTHKKDQIEVLGPAPRNGKNVSEQQSVAEKVKPLFFPNEAVRLAWAFWSWPPGVVAGPRHMRGNPACCFLGPRQLST